MRRSLQAFLGCAVILFGTVSVAPLLARASAPRALYKALLASPIPQAQLPKDFHAAKPTPYSPSSRARRHHVVGEVKIAVNKNAGAIVYILFPSRVDALGNFKDGLKTAKAQGTTVTPLSHFPQPAAILNASIQGGGFGFTQATFVTGKVSISTGMAGRKATARRADALALARVAFRHLKAVERRFAH